jgi:hypothetical protein
VTALALESSAAPLTWGYKGQGEGGVIAAGSRGEGLKRLASLS